MPSRWVERFLPGVRAGGRVLDVACGSGRHLAAVLASGRVAVGVDRDVGRAGEIDGLDRLTLIEADLEGGGNLPFDGGQFDGVICTNYLWRPILPAIVGAVAGDGVLIYETFALGNAHYGRPSNPDYLLRSGELIEAVVPRLTVVAYEHVLLREPDRVVQRICAVGHKHSWTDDGCAAS